MKGNNEEHKKESPQNDWSFQRKKKENTHMYKDIYGKVNAARLH